MVNAYEADGGVVRDPSVICDGSCPRKSLELSTKRLYALSLNIALEIPVRRKKCGTLYVSVTVRRRMWARHLPPEVTLIVHLPAVSSKVVCVFYLLLWAKELFCLTLRRQGGRQ